MSISTICCIIFSNMKRKTKIILGAIIGFILTASLAVSIPFIVLAIRTNNLNKDYSYLKQDSAYSQKVEVEGLELVTQHISCGYATIEMLSTYYGKKVSEDDLSKKNNGNISTSSTNGFYKEVNSSIDKSFVEKKYLANDIFLKEIYKSLDNNHPVAIEWAAKYEGEWTLHFSIVSAIDLYNDEVTIYNPYGYIETIDVSTFLSRTTFQAYTNIPLFLNFGFAFGAFHKNTLFYVGE